MKVYVTYVPAVSACGDIGGDSDCENDGCSDSNAVSSGIKREAIPIKNHDAQSCAEADTGDEGDHSGAA